MIDRPPYNHTRGDSALYPCKLCKEIRKENAVKALAAFLFKTQSPLSILLQMGQNSFHESWNDARDALYLNGWHDEKQAEDALRRVFGMSVKKAKKVKAKT